MRDRAAAQRAPERSCVGCGRRAAKRELVRLTSVEGVLAVDPAARLPGRGAYVCPRRECTEAALRRRGFERTLRAPVSIPPDVIDLIVRAAPGGRDES